MKLVGKIVLGCCVTLSLVAVVALVVASEDETIKMNDDSDGLVLHNDEKR